MNPAIPKIKTILYATDLSENASYAFNYAVSLANQYGAKITVLHVMETLSSSAVSQINAFLGDKKWQEIQEWKEREFMETIRDRIANFCEKKSTELNECPFIVEDILIRQGNPAKEILAQAGGGDYDMLIMGSHGHGLLADALLGSTARRVVRKCRKPVMVVRLPRGND